MPDTRRCPQATIVPEIVVAKRQTPCTRTEKQRFVLVLSNRTHPKDHGSKSKEAQYRTLAHIGDLALEAVAS